MTLATRAVQAEKVPAAGSLNFGVLAVYTCRDRWATLFAEPPHATQRQWCTGDAHSHGAPTCSTLECAAARAVSASSTWRNWCGTTPSTHRWAVDSRTFWAKDSLRFLTCQYWGCMYFMYLSYCWVRRASWDAVSQVVYFRRSRRGGQFFKYSSSEEVFEPVEDAALGLFTGQGVSQPLQAAAKITRSMFVCQARPHDRPGNSVA